MIPFDFAYARPDTAKEAYDLWQDCHASGHRPVYYSGGTELITLCRDMKIEPDLVIDIKSIPECNVVEQQSAIVYGAALSLNRIAEEANPGLMAQCVGGIADRTTRNQITLGGNIMGSLPYREALLPFLVMDGTAMVAGEKGQKEIPLYPYSKRIRLEPGEFITRFIVNADKTGQPFFHARNTKDSPVDYPILTACFSGGPSRVAMAVSGAFSSPIRDAATEEILNRTTVPIPERAERAVDGLASRLKTDFRASAQYRQHLLKLAIQEALQEIEA